MEKFIKVAGTEGKVGGYFCRLPPVNENTAISLLLVITKSKSQPDKSSCSVCHYKVMPNQPIILLVTEVNGFPDETVS